MLKLIDFWAEWCPPCKTMGPVAEEVAKELKDKVELVKIDVDKAREEALKYEVFAIPTFVLEKDGKEIARTTGAKTKEKFKEWVEEHL
jgi:thioredoxin 1